MFFNLNYEKIKYLGLESRYLNNDHVTKVLKEIVPASQLEVVGFSVEDRPIAQVKIGNGKITVFAWSQMHGNESTTTRAVIDLISFFFSKDEDASLDTILDNFTLYVIPVLNPDGARNYTRENANGIDLNRDMQNLSQPESRVLKAQFDRIKPDYCLNLHDQRSIFSAGSKKEPAILSFLAPASDKERSITPERKESMWLISKISEKLQTEIPNKIGRYDDAFNINCAGDTFQSLHVPTILFEAGHFPGDYKREGTRRLVFKALFNLFHALLSPTKNIDDYKDYFKIPKNDKYFNDIILRNVKLRDSVKDISIQYKEELKGEEICFIPIIQKIAPTILNYGHREIDLTGKTVNFSENAAIHANVIVNKISINGKKLILQPSYF